MSISYHGWMAETRPARWLTGPAWGEDTMRGGVLRSTKGSFFRGLVASAALVLGACADDAPPAPEETPEEGSLYLVHSAVETNATG